MKTNAYTIYYHCRLSTSERIRTNQFCCIQRDLQGKHPKFDHFYRWYSDRNTDGFLWFQDKDFILRFDFSCQMVFAIFDHFCLASIIVEVTDSIWCGSVPFITSFEEVGSPALLYLRGQTTCPLFVAASSRSPRLFLRRFLCWLPSLLLPPRSYWDADRTPIFQKEKYCEQGVVRNKNIRKQHWRQMISITINTLHTYVKPPPEFSIPTTLDINSLVDRQPDQI